MKKMLIVAMMMTIAISANAITRTEARVMTDRMAYDLRLDARQWNEVYYINLNYVPNSPRKTSALARVLTPRQFDKYVALTHRPLVAPVPARHHVHAAPALKPHRPAVVHRTGAHRR